MRPGFSSFVVSQATSIPVAEWKAAWDDGGWHRGFSAVTAKGHEVFLRQDSRREAGLGDGYDHFIRVVMDGEVLAEQKANALIFKLPLQALWDRLMQHYDVTRIGRERSQRQADARRKAEWDDLRNRF